MFILSSQDEIASELKDNLKSINTECARFTELKKTYEAKRDHYVKTLNDMTAKNWGLLKCEFKCINPRNNSISLM